MTSQLVDHVLHTAESHHPWKADHIERLAVRGHTASGVRVTPGTLSGTTARPGQAVINRPDHLVYCLVDDGAWAEAQRVHGAWQAALDALASALRDLGRYDERLAAAGKDAANPLTPTVIHLYLPPDRYYAPSYFWSGDVPALRHAAAERHTAKMVKLGDYPAAQTHCYLCPDAAAWAHVEELHAAAVTARRAWCDLLKRLGTYAKARADGRYAPGLLV
jgi:hypothetical protein